MPMFFRVHSRRSHAPASRLSRALLTATMAISGGLALSACTTTAPAPNSPGATTSLHETQSSGPSRWELVRWQQPDGALKPIPEGDNGQSIVFEFNAGIDSADGTVSGYSGCNRFTGRYGKTDTGMRFDRIAGTRMACATPGGEFETSLLKAMQAPFTTVATQPSAASPGKQIIWKTQDGDLLQFVEREGIGRRGAKLEAGVEKTVYVDSQRVDCAGVAKQTCYRVRDNPDAPWTLWYGPIEGLDFEPGVAYKLRVRETRVINPPADGPSIRWQLLGVESRTRAN
jgi:heat shock protein HslJ